MLFFKQILLVLQASLIPKLLSYLTLSGGISILSDFVKMIYIYYCSGGGKGKTGVFQKDFNK